MGEVAALFDTNIVIDLLDGVPQALTEIKRIENRSISIVTWIEVLVGVHPHEMHDATALLKRFSLVPLTPQIAELTISIRKQHRLKLPDAIIFATAQAEDRVLITRNTRDFSPDLPGIRVPYRL